MGRPTMGGLVGRFLASLLLVLATYNPTGMSFVSWIAGNFPHIQPIQAVVGVALLAVWIFFAQATWRSLGTLGLSWALIRVRVSGQAVVEEVDR